ncbi:alpha/beta fold hydrolase [Butyrivibrio proteoclasticus]|uniref:alpha/beta fold hydrolase n=1 Tax=Butyrivibrio proteoclasticus TaxID=43305 RepID=UPI0005501711|nr:alpha/beta hydrolase [Butyrivibrio proteoclasticus]
MSKKIAVIFPGIGYHTDKPLLYYAKKLAKQHDYEIIEIKYEFDQDVINVKHNEHNMHRAVEEFYLQAVKQLSDVNISAYNDVLFVGKSIGTAVAGRLAQLKELSLKQIVFTPVKATFQYLVKENTLVFHGLDDPWCPNDLAQENADKVGYEYHTIEGANHSLETGDVCKDVENLQKIFERVAEFVAE